MRPSHNKSLPKAFTLVELLVVVSILVILITLVISVANSVRGKGFDQQVRGDMAVLMAMVNDYHDAMGKYPANAPYPVYDANAWVNPANSDANRKAMAQYNCGVLLCGTSGWNPNASKPMGGLMAIDSIFGQIMDKYATRIEVGNGNLDGIPPGTPVNYRFLNDGFGDHKPFNYLMNGGAGGTPVIISAGEDRIWNTADDIRSDEHQ